MVGSGLFADDSGVCRCTWCEATPLYRAYHDTEWGFPVADEARLLLARQMQRRSAGFDLLDEHAAPPVMSFDEAMRTVENGAILVDGRSPEEFALGHLKGAVNIGLEGRYAEFAGSVVEPDVDIVLMTDPGQELEGKNRLARIGFDRVVGCLPDPERVMFTHRGEVRTASRLTTTAFGERRADVPDLQIVDVRNPGEADAGMIPGAVNIPVGQLPDRTDELDPARPTVVYCAGGYRSSVAASLLRSRGFTGVADILGGYDAVAASAAV